MNNKGKTNVFLILAIIAIAVFALFYVFKGEVLPEREEIINGYWDEATQECRSAPDRPTGIPYIPGQIGTTLYQCCFNQQGQQVDCNSPDLLWGAGSFAIYQGQAGLFFVTHGITITNTGNVDLSNAWVDSATWTPTHAELTNAYSSIVGSVYGVVLTQGFANDWSTGQIGLQTIGGAPGSPATYTLSLITKASATGLLDSSKTTPAAITVEQEGIGFSVEINLGA